MHAYSNFYCIKLLVSYKTNNSYNREVNEDSKPVFRVEKLTFFNSIAICTVFSMAVEQIPLYLKSIGI